ncbi:5-(carboxyamino)imidazole ribonucleotide synthase [Liquorilactobacillus capillatus]|uniref:N5-carboxyaminoimidazole ribonucleotide synthase n=1 Tax=Liquorilactobacillus capillatus DSM 19910 TaxID=1423731 RepID=A0A0R1M504_9LACO|nr:5-(carboxyamino)imidazole ribonucleotide synthase [Liquorilactobacillus capillatus]KRL03158.1 phosphoribosylaminoimidazole carboxylase ATPase subunit [Liquorilactobacillus capillatus DSM 19910]
MTKFIEQGRTIGIIGGGQLGQMLAFSAKKAGFRVLILDPNPDCSAGQTADDQIVAPYADLKAIEELARRSDVLTYEFENVDLQALEDAKEIVSIPQGTKLLAITKDRIREKTFLQEHGLEVAPFAAINNVVDLEEAVKKIGYPAVLKTCQGGYDGKAQLVLKKKEDLPEAAELLEKGQCILEGWVHFDKECSVMIGRSASGETSVFPVSENIHRNQILHESIIPARLPLNVQQKAQQMAKKIAAGINLCGILGVEMFVNAEGKIFINELAPRPHNSGHYSIEACNFSQFDIHNRAICAWPMPRIELLKPVVMVNILGQHVAGCRQLVKEKPQWQFHDYGKGEVRHDRKMGHVTILTDQLTDTLDEIASTKVWD